jgi:hypothetical protein
MFLEKVKTLLNSKNVVVLCLNLWFKFKSIETKLQNNLFIYSAQFDFDLESCQPTDFFPFWFSFPVGLPACQAQLGLLAQVSPSCRLPPPVGSCRCRHPVPATTAAPRPSGHPPTPLSCSHDASPSFSPNGTPFCCLLFTKRTSHWRRTFGRWPGSNPFDRLTAWAYKRHDELHRSTPRPNTHPSPLVLAQIFVSPSYITRCRASSSMAQISHPTAQIHRWWASPSTSPSFPLTASSSRAS